MTSHCAMSNERHWTNIVVAQTLRKGTMKGDEPKQVTPGGYGRRIRSFRQGVCERTEGHSQGRSESIRQFT